jgi:hypothetical protein
MAQSASRDKGRISAMEMQKAVQLEVELHGLL